MWYVIKALYARKGNDMFALYETRWLRLLMCLFVVFWFVMIAASVVFSCCSKNKGYWNKKWIYFSSVVWYKLYLVWNLLHFSFTVPFQSFSSKVLCWLFHIKLILSIFLNVEFQPIFSFFSRLVSVGWLVLVPH